MTKQSRKELGKVFGGLSHAERRHEFLGTVFFFAALIIALSLASFSPVDPVFVSPWRKSSNLFGLVGAHLANGLLSLLGVASFVLVAAQLSKPPFCTRAACAVPTKANTITKTKPIKQINFLYIHNTSFKN